MSFAQDKIASEGLTFDDVLLLPAFSEIMPREVSIRSQFTRNIELNTPIVSAAMDTVTEEKLAITIAHEGGIGVIHKNMPLEEQTRQVRKVKRAESVMIHEPITIKKEGTVNDALNLMKEYKNDMVFIGHMDIERIFEEKTFFKKLKERIDLLKKSCFYIYSADYPIMPNISFKDYSRAIEAVRECGVY